MKYNENLILFVKLTGHNEWNDDCKDSHDDNDIVEHVDSCLIL